MPKKRDRHPKRGDAKPWRPGRWLALAVTVGATVMVVVGVVLAVLSSGSGGPATTKQEAVTKDATSAAEPFRSFLNRSGYPDGVLWEAYRYAAANPQTLAYIPCFCGCSHHGDANNLQCYIDGMKADGSVKYDPHAASCGLCVAITSDVMRLLDQGKSLRETRSYIDATYGQYGPSTDTPLPPE